MSVLAPLNSCTSVYQNGGSRCGNEMEAGPVPTQRRYTLNEDFYKVLEGVGAERNKAYEWKDVIMLFLRYLAKRKPSLFDPDDKSRVMCQDDPLGTLFGVPSFTKDETRLLVRQQLSLVEDERLLAGLPPCPPTGPGIEQVKRGPALDDDPDSKRSRPDAATEAAAAAAAGAGPSAAAPPLPTAELHRMDTLETTDGGGADSAPVPETESECDEADDHRRTYAHEMEPVGCTDLGESEDSSSGESDAECRSPLELTVISVWVDDGILADMETSDSDAENGDRWVCAAPSCRTTNKARRSRCDHCWRTRPDWVVGPRRKKRRRRERAGLPERLRRSNLPTAAAAAASTSTSDVSEGRPGSVDTGYGSQDTPLPAADQTCIICCEKGREAAIIHGRTGCQVTCYNCARILWKKKDLCPACRRSIEKIVYMRFG